MALLDLFSADVSMQIGWIGVLLGFLSGMMLGTVTHVLAYGDRWMGGYSGRPRRYVRLGHIALVALGMLNILAGISLHIGFSFPPLGQALLAVGLITMPTVCFLTAMSDRAFYLFPIPALSLFTAVLVLLKEWK